MRVFQTIVDRQPRRNRVPHHPHCQRLGIESVAVFSMPTGMRCM